MKTDWNWKTLAVAAVLLLLGINIVAWAVVYESGADKAEADAQSLHGELGRIQDSLSESQARLVRIETYLQEVASAREAQIRMSGNSTIDMDGDASIWMDQE